MKSQFVLVMPFMSVIHYSLESPKHPKTPPATHKSGWFCLPRVLHIISLSKSKQKTASFQDTNHTTNSPKTLARLQNILFLFPQPLFYAGSAQENGYKSINAVPSQQPYALQKRVHSFVFEKIISFTPELSSR